MGASVGERVNIQTRAGNRVSTISLLGCSTSVALAMGPTDEEEQSRPFGFPVINVCNKGNIMKRPVYIRHTTVRTSTYRSNL